ncbi:glycosyltransferase [Lutibacter sp. HS1-25]|uniref:glycosyltransferase n=1 Tax=Lutibacter sp. HS1-25 TaxID=2485000 RepID=UPI001012B0EC|nr:glycosyltransferase [Lutibacter sp. HS1-25]RXP63278.1 glycosyltransferase [Lutibacter sp. HS1-25]
MKNSLNILFLCGWYPSRVLPTNGDFVQRHAEAIATKHNVTLIHVITDNKINKTEKTFQTVNNVNTHIIYIPKTRNLFLKFFLFFNTYITTIKTIKDFDVVHLNITYPVGLIALYVKYFIKIPYIITEHWSGYQFPNNKSIGLFEKILSKIIVKKASFVCPVAKYLEKAMICFGLKGNYYPIPNVVDTDIFNISNNNSEHFTITHVSGMDNEVKNIKGILSVISKLQSKIPNLEFNLIGSNSAKYTELIEKLKIKNIHIIDQISNAEVSNYLKKSNLFILFSNYENLPCVILEAFSCGIPVIATNVGGINEYFPNNFGKLISIKNEEQLYQETLNLYEKKYTIASKEEIHNYAVKNFSKEHICNEYSRIYLKTIISF